MKKINSKLIFLVDDDETYLDTLAHHLEQKMDTSITLRKFSTGEECLLQLYLEPDIVILDYQLNTNDKKAMNGIEVLKKIKALNKKVEIVMLSGQDSLEVAVNCIKNGAHDYIIKNESAFVRAKHLVKNMLYTLGLNKDVKQYERWNWIIAAVLLVVLICDIVYAATRL